LIILAEKNVNATHFVLGTSCGAHSNRYAILTKKLASEFQNPPRGL